MRLTYLIGEPGVGKSTAMRLALGEPEAVLTKPFAHALYEFPLMQLGLPSGPFPGTDRLSMSVQPRVLAYLNHFRNAPYHVVGEGDRLANAKFFDALPCPFRIIVAEGPSRNRESQNESWRKGRATKVRRLVERYDPIPLDTNRPPEEVGDELRALFDWTD